MAHPELNPIEMVWSIVKRYSAGRNPKFSLNDVEARMMDQINKITAEDFKKYGRYSKKEEDNYRQLSEVA